MLGIYLSNKNTLFKKKKEIIQHNLCSNEALLMSTICTLKSYKNRYQNKQTTFTTL